MSYILIYVFLFLSLTPLCSSKTNIHLVHHRKHNISEILKLDRLRVESIHLSLQRRSISISESSPSLPLSSGISLGAAEYLVQVGLGTPPASLYLVMDTGSDITWLQCSPCVQCYIQSDPLFSPQNSSTYELLSCSSPVCEELTTSSCEERVSSCLYHVQYLDTSSSSGVLSKEVFTLAGGRRVPTKILFGCGNVNMGLFTGYSGILGMGGGPYSFPLQLPDNLGSSFSYCMVDRESPQQISSPLVLGDEEQGTVFSYTPLLTNPRSSTHYFVNLEGISVNSELLDVPRSLFEMDENGLGGVVIDSGTTLTHLPAPAYNELLRRGR